ncbi:MAG: hypothetical protein K1X70_05515 [Leptospirales bacterium]|nr:hypothetical protein [Leptospirales bacterium]HMU84824.1 hypothetical protein [Leptospiraceae bacterium]HMW61528.1 hypothetical protein [Leptospiraceae bacterium]HNJ35238.1 hypothetical protein [Leptospiraceae bacterium]HNL69771.1 hypothetical protein [Leptospiraceae bacterium]
MSVEIFHRVTLDLASALRDDPEGMATAYAGEPLPEQVPLIYRPPGKKESPQVQSDLSSPGSPGKQPGKPPVREIAKKHLPANFTCELCPDRLFPVRRFQRAGKIPVLFVFFNGSVVPTRVRPDKSNDFILSSKQEDDYFASFLSPYGFALDSFYYQQFPACHFNPERSSLGDWQRRSDACLVHLKAAVETAQIQHLILTSPSSQFLLGKDESQRLMTSGEEFLFERSGIRLTGHVMRRADPKNEESQARFKSILAAVQKRFHV